MNYQIMSGDQKEEGKYYPDYDSLMNNASCETEREYISKVRERNFGFAYNMVYVAKQKCGHFEIFQTPLNQWYTLEDNLRVGKEHTETMKCSHCISNFKPITML